MVSRSGPTANALKKGRSKSGRRRIRRRLIIERLGDRRVLASITGSVFHDDNDSLRRDGDEAGAAARLIYVDANRNAVFDVGESFSLADDEGRFAFNDLADGTYLLRLFSGTPTQQPTFPLIATLAGDSISVEGGTELLSAANRSYIIAGESLVVADLESGTTAGATIEGGELDSMHALPDGDLLIIGSDGEGQTAWRFDSDTQTLSPTDLGQSDAMRWTGAAVDGDGRGVLLESSGEETLVYSLSATADGQPISVTSTATAVASDTQVLASATGSRTVFAWGSTEGQSGLQLSLWSNLDASYITAAPVLTDADSLLDFDDAAGLLAVRTIGGGVSVLDVDAGFAPLHTLPTFNGPVTLDGGRDLLMAISPVESLLKIIDLRDGSLIADLAIDLSSVGTVASLARSDQRDSVVVLGAAGLVEVGLKRQSAQEVEISGGQPVDGVLFGISIDGPNQAPALLEPPGFETDEDQPLDVVAPGVLEFADDPDGDSFVVLQVDQPAHGEADVQIDGSLRYVPNEHFNGTDVVTVRVHDGRDLSESLSIEITVHPIPDPLTGVEMRLNVVREDLSDGGVVGQLDIHDADGINHRVEISDDRFGFANGDLIYLGGGLDFETEPEIPISVAVVDPQTEQELIAEATLGVSDANDPITAITPVNASVLENSPGDVIAELRVHDQDAEQFHVLSVDDPRFEIDELDLRLATGVALDFEVEEIVLVNVTATEVPGGGTFTQTISITVIDQPDGEPSDSLGLTNQTVMELKLGAEVGEVTINDGPPPSEFVFAVDDPRFEVNGTTLKLLDDEYVERVGDAESTQIRLVITAQDSTGVAEDIEQAFLIEVLENAHPNHNPDIPEDVDHGGNVTPLDALIIINYLNSYGPGPVEPGDLGYCYDVNGDGMVTALDALLVVHELNRLQQQASVQGQSDGNNPAPVGTLPSIGQTDPTRRLDSKSVQDAPSDLNSKTTQKSISAPGDASGSQASPPADGPESWSIDDYAQNIDATIRLLSDEDA